LFVSTERSSSSETGSEKKVISFSNSIDFIIH
jgi:hypothetical protein